MEKVTHGKTNSRVRGSFLSLEGNQTIRWGRGEERKREKERKKKREKENRAWRSKKRKGKWLRFPMFQRSEVVRQRIKFGILDESYE